MREKLRKESMPTTDTSEKGLESLIVSALTGKPISDTVTATRDERAPSVHSVPLWPMPCLNLHNHA